MPRSCLEQNETNIARAESLLDERDHAILLSLLEHKVLTTDQIKSLYFGSIRRCQHRLKELKNLELTAPFTPRRGFAEGRPPACWFLTKAGLSVCAGRKGVRASELSWIPYEGYQGSQNLAHRLGVNAFFCALVEASRAHEDHCPAAWRPERWVRTPTAEVKATGSGGYPHPAGACEFYLEYDRGTEAVGALSRKLEGYLRLAAGWTEEQEPTGLPNLLIVVPERVSEGEVGSALRHAIGRLRVPESLATSFPLYVAGEDALTEYGVLAPAWSHLLTGSEPLSLIELPARPRDPYRATRCLGRYFTDAPAHARQRLLCPARRDGLPLRVHLRVLHLLRHDSGVPPYAAEGFDAVIEGFRRAQETAEASFGVRTQLIMCFLRDMTTASAMDTLERSLPYRDWIVGVGLDSDERATPRSSSPRCSPERAARATG